MFDILNELSYRITNNMATALYGAISSDTNQFTNSNVTASTFYTSVDLLKLKANKNIVNWFLHKYKTYDQLKLAAYMAFTFKISKRRCFIFDTLKTIKRIKCKNWGYNRLFTFNY